MQAFNHKRFTRCTKNGAHDGTHPPYKVPSVTDWMLRVVKSSPKLEITSVALLVALWIASLALRLKTWSKFTKVGTHRLATGKKQKVSI